MDDVQSRWSNMVWKRFQTYFSVRAIHLNSMFSNFCHVLKFFYFIPIIAIITVFSSVALAFFGYHLINKKSRDNEIDKNVIS